MHVDIHVVSCLYNPQSISPSHLCPCMLSVSLALSIRESLMVGVVKKRVVVM